MFISVDSMESAEDCEILNERWLLSCINLQY
jgi:hypothetical protein